VDYALTTVSVPLDLQGILVWRDRMAIKSCRCQFLTPCRTNSCTFLYLAPSGLVLERFAVMLGCKTKQDDAIHLTLSRAAYDSTCVQLSETCQHSDSKLLHYSPNVSHCLSDFMLNIHNTLLHRNYGTIRFNGAIHTKSNFLSTSSFTML
jgi:hypothetical protein